jgi:septation ring formation regulator EzrA
MSLQNDIELDNTRAKLLRLEKRYEELRNDTSEDEHVRELTLRSLKGSINQFQEEIARYNAGASNGGGRDRILQNEREVANTREKLRRLEKRYEEIRQETAGRRVSRETELTSLKRLINQFKEEIARYESRQSVRR